jgi:lipopolysaccharide biosynthesis regulator YciM
LKIKLANEPLNEFWIVLHGYVHNLLDGKSGYRCSRCGFGARAHHWQCPSCKSWGAIKPVHGVMGD